ncbi:olfactory receptor 10AG1-like [Monodelphis domestica]|uniref:olfactory receptor 10AG1-like n=1 Tax=Monodelphis domestica TaxID=13616 RepID=UPI0024E19D73|nr:olfactory receptor 10AG1-like [Monodelphis domestica]
MAGENVSFVVEFILLGFYNLPNLQGVLFGVFLVIFMYILIGNGLIVVITRVDPALQTPMYFFLGNFSFLEICYTSAIVPRMLSDLWTQKRQISLLACAVQLCFFYILAALEFLLLGIMAYDRYVAICKPLYYPIIMNNKVCNMLILGSLILATPVMIGETYQIFTLPFCGSNELNHLFCDVTSLLKLACGDTSVNEFSLYIICVVLGFVPFLLILVSYIRIINTILKLPSVGRQKAFSTCSSHLIVVVLFYGSVIITYIQPKSVHSAEKDKMLSLLYTIVTPMFNPIIYTLRNKDVISSLKKIITKGLLSLRK